MFQRTTAQSKIIKLKKRIRIVRGGTSSSKTFSIIPLLIDYACNNPKSEISIVSETLPHLKKGAIRDFIKIMEFTNLYNDRSWNRTENIYKFSNGSYIEFFSVDQPGKVRGPRRHILFVNECNNIKHEIFEQLEIRTEKFIYLDYNPAKEFWVDKHLIGDEDAELLVLTYKDNEALADSIIKSIEAKKRKGYYDYDLPVPALFDESNIKSKYYHNWWKVYGLGMIGNIEGIVFENWEIITKLPEDARLVGIGVDFGYTNDPTSIIEIYVMDGKRYINEICYKTGMVNEDIAKMLPKNVIVYADSAEPKSIEEIRRKGIKIKAVKKGADSIKFGIQLMQAEEYCVTSQSTNIIKELRGYCWDKDKEGNSLNKPVGDDHAIDAWRYHEMMSIGIHKNRGNYSVS